MQKINQIDIRSQKNLFENSEEAVFLEKQLKNIQS